MENRHKLDTKNIYSLLKKKKTMVILTAETGTRCLGSKKEEHLTELERKRGLERGHQKDIIRDLIRAEANTLSLKR